MNSEFPIFRPRALLHRVGALLFAIWHVACSPEPMAQTTPWTWNLPDYIQKPPLPNSNPMTVESVELGRRLFFEQRLSLGETLSCASCHDPKLAFALNEALHRGATGELTARNAPSLANLAWAVFLNWGNLTSTSLEQQMLNPLFGDNPIEMGSGFVPGSSNHYDLKRLFDLTNQNPSYERDFRRVFSARPWDEQITWDTAIAAIATFQRSLISLDSPWDKWLAGDDTALSPSAQRGLELFNSSELGCSTCHAGPFLSLAFPADDSRPTIDELFRNTGLYYLKEGPTAYWNGSRSNYPAGNQGIGEFTQDPKDDGKHRIPSLRNVALTAPYMHDGSISTLEGVLAHYARGGSITVGGENAGDGRLNPAKDPLIKGFTLTPTNADDLIAFLKSLTDATFVSHPWDTNRSAQKDKAMD